MKRLPTPFPFFNQSKKPKIPSYAPPRNQYTENEGRSEGPNTSMGASALPYTKLPTSKIPYNCPGMGSGSRYNQGESSTGPMSATATNFHQPYYPQSERPIRPQSYPRPSVPPSTQHHQYENQRVSEQTTHMNSSYTVGYRNTHTTPMTPPDSTPHHPAAAWQTMRHPGGWTQQQQPTGSRAPMKEVTNITTPSNQVRNTSAKQQTQSVQKQGRVQSGVGMLRNQTRVITASSQGIQYWSQYKTYCHLLFEVFGVIDSQVTRGDFNCQQFMLKTIDGVIKCQFWEIDQKLANLYRGKSYRVIGNWDSNSRGLKCVKVRQATDDENRYNNELVKLSDSAMREFTSSIAEP